MTGAWLTGADTVTGDSQNEDPIDLESMSAAASGPLLVAAAAAAEVAAVVAAPCAVISMSPAMLPRDAIECQCCCPAGTWVAQLTKTRTSSVRQAQFKAPINDYLP